MPGIHARLSPSSCSRWWVCPGSVGRCEGIEENPTEFSAEGTAAHEIRERCLKEGRDVEDFLGETVKADGMHFEVTDEWVAKMQPGIDRIREHGGKLYTERLVYYHKFGDKTKKNDQFGTLDTGIITNKRIIIDDFKWGKGIVVDVEKNKQLMIYALGFWENVARHVTDVERFLLRIDQPRVEGGGGEWETTLDELLGFANGLKKAVKRTYEPDAKLVPGESQCRMCPARHKCPAYDSWCMEMMDVEFEDLDERAERDFAIRLPRVTKLTPERRSYIVKNAPVIRKWLSELHDATLDDAMEGKPTPGFKAAIGREGDREWMYEDLVDLRLDKLLGDEKFNKKLKSPAQVEKVLPKKVFEKLKKFIHREEGKPALVAEDSKSERITPHKIEFDNLNEE